MTLDSVKLAKVAQEAFGQLPHPDVPEITNAEYPVYERVASMMRNPHKPTHMDVKDAFHQLKSVDLSPHEWEHAWTVSRPVANRLLGRDPTIQELIRHRDAHPADIHDYYYHSPSTSHPEFKAGVMAKYMHMASESASRHVERKPLLQEAALFAASDFTHEHIDQHYERMKQETEATTDA
jgi:hypothetical protein